MNSSALHRLNLKCLYHDEKVFTSHSGTDGGKNLFFSAIGHFKKSPKKNSNLNRATENDLFIPSDSIK